MTKKIIMKGQEFIHPILLKLFSSKTTGDMIVDGVFPNDGTYLIVANHLCIQDIPQLAQAVQKHFYLLVSDEDKYTIDGLGLTLNGVRWVHRTDKDSRKMSASSIVETLKDGKNFAMYPEATWNLSPNLLMLPMNYGCIRTALEAGVQIVPVVTFFSAGERHTKIGDKFIPTDNLSESIELLRDTMASMLYEEIFEYYERHYDEDSRIFLDTTDGIVSYYEKRDDISYDYWEQHIDNLYNQYDRAKRDKAVVMDFESQFIFTPKTDDYSYFQEFNSSIRFEEDKMKIIRITSEHNGYNGISCDDIDYKEYFGLGYNTHVLKRQLKK